MISLTKRQKALLKDLADVPAAHSVECAADEWKTAISLEKRGLVTILHGKSVLGSFEIAHPEVRANPQGEAA
jgi:hypothetical protein